MSGDKLKRVKAVRKWLERAEDSYSSHEEISGELNLIMAKAEMQRLDEVHPHRKLRKWGLRGGALLVAFCILGGVSFITGSREQPKADPLVPVDVVAREGQAETPAAPAAAEEPQAPVEALPAAAPVQTVNAAAVEVREQAAPAPAPAPAPRREVQAPVLSASEIQSVVGEAGRTLRGETP